MEEVLLCVVRMMFHLMFSFKSHGLVHYIITTLEVSLCVFGGLCVLYLLSLAVWCLSCVDNLLCSIDFILCG